MAKISAFALVSSCERTKISEEFVSKPNFYAATPVDEIQDTIPARSHMDTDLRPVAENTRRAKLTIAFNKGNAEKMTLRREYAKAITEYADLFEDCFMAQGHVWACPLPGNFPTAEDVLRGNVNHTPLRTALKNVWQAYEFLYEAFIEGKIPGGPEFFGQAKLVAPDASQEILKRELQVLQPQSLHDLFALFVEAAAQQMISASETNLIVLRHILAIAETGNVEISVERFSPSGGADIMIQKNADGQMYSVNIADAAEEIKISYSRGPKKKTTPQEDTPKNEVD